MTYARGGVDTKDGRITVSIQRQGNTAKLQIWTAQGMEAALAWGGTIYPLASGEETEFELPLTDDMRGKASICSSSEQ